MSSADVDAHALAAGAVKGHLPILHFADARTLANWLSINGATAPGAWLMFAKKGAASRSVTRQESIDAALCEGWIDGQAAIWDDNYFLVRFTPRRPRGNWSQVNRARAAELIKLERMRPCGLAEIEAARADGRWEAAYLPPSTAETPPDLQAAIDARQPATRVRRIAALCTPVNDGSLS